MMSRQEKKVVKLDAVVVAVSIGLLFINYLAFHVAVELVCAFVAFFTSSIILRSRENRSSSFLSILALTLISVGLVDILHLLAYKGMGVLPVDEPNAATQFWIIGRYILTAGMLAALLYSAQSYQLLFATGIGIPSLVLIISVFSGHFPDAFIDGQGLTQFKVISEYLIIAVLIVCILLVSLRQPIFGLTGQILLISALGITIFSELMFTLYQDVYGIFNAAGHISKLLAYMALFHLFLFHNKRAN